MIDATQPTLQEPACRQAGAGARRRSTVRRRRSALKKSATNQYSLFISSVQKELAAERRAVKDFITHDALLSRFISDVFLFEDIPPGTASLTIST